MHNSHTESKETSSNTRFEKSPHRCSWPVHSTFFFAHRRLLFFDRSYSFFSSFYFLSAPSVNFSRSLVLNKNVSIGQRESRSRSTDWAKWLQCVSMYYNTQVHAVDHKNLAGIVFCCLNAIFLLFFVVCFTRCHTKSQIQNLPTKRKDFSEPNVLAKAMSVRLCLWCQRRRCQQCSIVFTRPA